MQYSPNNDVPYVARVDAGTVELVRRCGVEVVSSADLVQRFEAVWSAEQYASHARAARAVRDVVDAAFAEIRRAARARRRVAKGTSSASSSTSSPRAGWSRITRRSSPSAPHSADPHYQPPPSGGAPIGAGDFVLIDLWAKEPAGVYADITWTGYVGDGGARALRAGLRHRAPGARRRRRGGAPRGACPARRCAAATSTRWCAT